MKKRGKTPIAQVCSNYYFYFSFAKLNCEKICFMHLYYSCYSATVNPTSSDVNRERTFITNHFGRFGNYP